MYKNILVAFDKSSVGEYVFKVSLDLAKANNASLMLLHILSKDSQYIPTNCDPNSTSSTSDSVDIYRQQWKQFEQESLELLNEGRVYTALWTTWQNDLHFC
jgi:nucleotide-binding universal stress UspA family protein